MKSKWEGEHGAGGVFDAQVHTMLQLELTRPRRRSLHTLYVTAPVHINRRQLIWITALLFTRPSFAPRPATHAMPCDGDEYGTNFNGERANRLLLSSEDCDMVWSTGYLAWICRYCCWIEEG